MIYQVSKVLLEEVGFFDDNALYYYDAGHIVQKKLDFISQKFGFDHLCLEIHDDSDLWYVAFEVVHNSKFLVCDDKLMVFSGNNDWLYLYCLRNKTCLDCFATHNQFLNHQCDYGLSATQCVINDQYGYVVVLNSRSLLVCDVAGVKWKVDHNMCCCFGLSVAGSRVLVKEDHVVCVTQGYDIHTGALLG